ncbi:MAG: hypothetical protein QOI05_3896, partial [Bradyrhizobium sp.]|nr:hypothetical protein [Bradyrhizobium sp.]
MSPQRFAKVAVMCGTVVLAAWCGGRLGVGPALVETTAAVPVEVRPAALLPAYTERADTARPMGNLAAVNADVAPVAEPETAVASEIPAAKDESKLIVEAALPDSPPLPAPEPPLVQVASADPSDPMPIEVKKAVAL